MNKHTNNVMWISIVKNSLDHPIVEFYREYTRYTYELNSWTRANRITRLISSYNLDLMNPVVITEFGIRLTYVNKEIK